MNSKVSDSLNKVEEKICRMEMEKDLGYVAMQLLTDLMDEHKKQDFNDDQQIALFYYEADRVLPMVSNTLYLALDNLSNSLEKSKEEVSRLQEQIRKLEQK